MTQYPPPSAPYVEALHQGGRQKPTAIILRPSFTNSKEGAALSVAQYWHRASSFWEAGHYVVDETKRFRCVRDNVIAGKDEVDKGAIRIALCADPVTKKVFWDAEEHSLVLNATAVLVAELCLAYKIRPVELSAEEFERWKKRRTRRRGGIYIHEPSGWPSELFLNHVRMKLSLKTHI